MLSTACQEHTDLQANHLDSKEKDTTMIAEEETGHPREKEETHPSAKEKAEKTATQEFASNLNPFCGHMPQTKKGRRKNKGKIHNTIS